MFRLFRTCFWMCFFCLGFGTGQMLAQGGACRDPWINQTFNQIYHRAPQGSGDSGECNINLYGGGQWSSYQDLYNKVVGSKDCQDPWIGEAYIVGLNRRASANACVASNYGGGHWSSFSDLVSKVQQFQNQVARSTPAPQPVTPPSTTVSGCKDPWITQAFNQIYHRAPQGSGDSGECSINIYGGGQWSSYQDLYNKVLGSKDCQDPWIGEAYLIALNRRASGNACLASNYGGGHWSSFGDLVGKVQQSQNQASSQPIARPGTPVNTAPHPGNGFNSAPGNQWGTASPQPQRPGWGARPSIALVSQLGSKCLDVEGGHIAAGTHLIGYPCNGQNNEQFTFQSNGTLTLGGLCVDAGSGNHDGDQLFLSHCLAAPSQRWYLSSGQLLTSSGKCVDLKGGSGWWFGNQPAILYACNGQPNQHWIEGVVISKSRIQGITPTQPGQLTSLAPVNASAGVIAAGGANVIAAGGGNVIAAGGANVIAAGGANVIAAGGANVIAAGGANAIVLAQP